MNWEVIFAPETLQLYGEGLLVTLQLLLELLAIGAVLALLMALALTSRQAWLRRLVGAYTFCIRGTPLLIQVYLIYYGLAQVEWIQQRWDDIWPWTYFKEPFFCALLAFALNNAGYTAEMLAGAIRETPAGEIEAAQAMGMSRWAVLRRIVLPSALRRTLPAYSNSCGAVRRAGGDRPDLFGLLSAVRGLSGSSRDLPLHQLCAGGPVQAGRGPLPGLSGAAPALIPRQRT